MAEKSRRMGYLNRRPFIRLFTVKSLSEHIKAYGRGFMGEGFQPIGIFTVSEDRYLCVRDFDCLFVNTRYLSY